ncbi:hypothetical protein MFIFM68171_01740 [Madurella fahalii]|uniref:Major facilitator superfamily (MFS) profile domain-containing protein n=1 Tax=Madurella fahalii TaxID=1157608 RepID=A0ABQ0G191_9PEZI
MDRVSSPTGRVQSPPEALETSPTRREQQESDALEARTDKAQMVATDSGDAGIAAHLSAGDPSGADPAPRPSAAIPTFNRGDTKSPPSPGTRTSSLATTAVSAPERQRYSLEPQADNPGTMCLLVTLAKLAAFSDVFLSGLVIPLIPSILESKTQIPHQQVQIWTSVLVSASGGAFAVVSPLMPLLTRQGPVLFAVLLAGLVCATCAFALLQLSSNLYLLIFARALQGFSAAATTGACAAMLATAASVSRQTRPVTGISPAFIQNTAMTAAPTVAGLLHDYVDPNAVFYCAYALIALNIFLGLIAANFASFSQGGSRYRAEARASGYGTIPSGAGRSRRRSSRGSSRSISPRARDGAGPSQPDISAVATVTWSTRLLVALYGYLIVGLLASSLHSVLPLFVKRHFKWSVSASGFLFMPLSAPAALVGPLAGMLAVRIPRSARVFAAIGFLACVPAFLYLGRLTENTELTQHAFLVTLSGISLAFGLCGDPLVIEITNVVGSGGGHLSSTTAQAASLPNLSNAWGSLVGPLFAGAISWVWGWETMSQSLAIVGAFTGVLSFLFLQGWIGSPYQGIRNAHDEASSDEEAAPLLVHDRSNDTSYGYAVESRSGKRADSDFYARTDDSDDTSPHTRSSQGRKHRSHRRHFSVDNFSIATTAGPGSVDSATTQVRFQAALETPTYGTVSGAPRRAPASDSSSRASSERRYVMREAPHAPPTDPLLAAGSLYVIDEERDAGRGVETERQKRRVVVFAEGTAPPELLERHRHHVVAINALDGTAQMVSSSTDNHSVHVTEETEEEVPGFPEATSRRYVVVVVEDEDDGDAEDAESK